MGSGAFKTHDNDRGKCFRIIVVRGARPPHDNDSEEFFRIIVVRGPRTAKIARNTIGSQNRYFLKGIEKKIVDFSIPGRSRPGPALKIDTF